MPEHLFDDRTQLHYIVWHKDPTLERFIEQIVEEVKPTCWVETGSHMGWTSMWMARRFPNLQIYTVEVDPGFYAKSKDNLAQFPNVVVEHDTSPKFLERLLPKISDGKPMFWLDAHWWPPVPLRDECKLVSSLPRYVALLDDFSCWEPDFSGDTFYSIAPSRGDAYLNDVSYVCSSLGEQYYRPAWTPGPGAKGVGLFIKGVDYVPPPHMMKPEDMNGFIESRGRSVARRKDELGFVSYPLHPSSGRIVGP